jgi:hypothetical protein
MDVSPIGKKPRPTTAALRRLVTKSSPALAKNWRIGENDRMAAQEKPDLRPWHRLHASSWVVLFAAVALFAFWNASGFIFIEVRESGSHSWRHGWPLTYLTRSAQFVRVQASPAGPAPPTALTPTPIWGLAQEVLNFRPVALAADALIALALAALVALAFDWRRRRRPRLFSFSLKEFFALSIVVAVAIFVVLRVESKRRETKELLARYGIDYFATDHALPGWLWTLLPPDSVKWGDRVTLLQFYFPQPADPTWDATQFKHVKHLNISRGGWNGSEPLINLADYQVHKFENLEYLGASFGSPIIGLAEIENLKGLRVLWLGQIATDAALVHVAGLTNLEELHLQGHRDGTYTDAGLVHLANLRQMKQLSIYSRSVTDAGLAHLSRMSDLEHLTLDGCPLSDDAMHQIAVFRRLKTLRMTGLHVSDAGLEPLSTLPHLNTLTLNAPQITGAGFSHFRRAVCLENLGLLNTGITDDGLEAIGQLTALKNLYLQRAKITDAGLANLRGLTKLERLTLEGGAITDAGLDALPELPRLSELLLIDTMVTFERAADWQPGRPGLTVTLR